MSNFVEPTNGVTSNTAVDPMDAEFKQTRTDFINSVLALGNASARARQILAQQTLVNVQRKKHHVPDNRF